MTQHNPNYIICKAGNNQFLLSNGLTKKITSIKVLFARTNGVSKNILPDISDEISYTYFTKCKGLL